MNVGSWHFCEIPSVNQFVRNSLQSGSLGRLYHIRDRRVEELAGIRRAQVVDQPSQPFHALSRGHGAVRTTHGRLNPTGIDDDAGNTAWREIDCETAHDHVHSPSPENSGSKNELHAPR